MKFCLVMAGLLLGTFFVIGALGALGIITKGPHEEPYNKLVPILVIPGVIFYLIGLAKSLRH